MISVREVHGRQSASRLHLWAGRSEWFVEPLRVEHGVGIPKPQRVRQVIHPKKATHSTETL
jgi:hypothetical protein